MTFAKLLILDYLDFVNNFLTLERFASYNEISLDTAKFRIEQGKKYHEFNVEYFKQHGEEYYK